MYVTTEQKFSHCYGPDDVEWFASQQKFTKPIEKQTKEELNKCIQKFYVAVHQKVGNHYKVFPTASNFSSDWAYLKQFIKKVSLFFCFFRDFY